MQTVIAGGHGKIALMLARQLSDRGERVRSLIRDPGQADDVTAAGGVPEVVDLESATDSEIDAAVSGCDAIVFAAGAGPDSGPERKESVDYGAAVKLIDAARRTGPSRYVMISAAGADPEAEGEDVFAVYLRAKGRADRELTSSGLDFTVVKPVRLTDDPGMARVTFDEDSLGPTIPREDVAATVAEVLHRDSSIGLTFKVSTGPEPISEVVGRLA